MDRLERPSSERFSDHPLIRYGVGGGLEIMKPLHTFLPIGGEGGLGAILT